MKKYRFSFWFWFFLITYLLIGSYLRFETSQSSLLVNWNMRDFERAFNLVDGEYVPLAGPDVNNGGRLPGPFLYFLLAIPLLIEYSYESIFFFNFLLNMGSILGLFFVLKKYIGPTVALLSTIILCIYLPMIGATGFPINPAFLFIFITFYFWALLELILNKNEKVIPLLVLVIVLGIQIHFSIITYILVPIILCIIFRIKPSFKTFLYTFGICLICFFPFALYKYKTFQGIDFGESTFVPHNWKSISLIPFMGNTLDGIFSRNGFWRLQHFPKLISVIYFLSLVIPFCYLLFQVVSNLKKFGIERFKKETIFLLQFYIPALIYDITNPFEGPTPHNWYSFIFIISHANLTALFLSTIYSKFKNSNLQRTVIFSGISLLLFMTIDAFLQTKTFKTNAKGNLLSDNFQERYYPENKSLDSLLTFFMNKLNLTPKEYYERVYFEGGSPWSYKKLQLLGKKINYSGNLPNNQTKKPCFYIHFTQFLGSREVTRFFENFLKDTKIVRNKSFPLRSNDQRLFWVYEYYPIIKQSCYNNSFNTFVVDKEIRDLGHQSKGIDKNKEKDIKYLSFNEIHNPNGTLDSLTGNYIIYDRTLRFPFGLGLSLYKKEGRYYLNCKIKSYYYHAAPYRLSNVNLFFIIDNHPKFKVNILTSNTLAAGYFTDNSKWYREVKLPINLELTKRNFQIKINWDVYIIKIDSENGNEILQISQSRRGYKNSFFLVH